MHDLTAMHCGPYEIWGPISEGGMSRVWLARHRELATPAIIKTLLDAPHDAYDRLRNEARLTARIPSPRVVRAVDVGVHEGTPYLVEEYVDGIDIAELDRRRRAAMGKSLPLWFVCRVVDAVADGLESAHQTGVVHRDVKPSNIFGSPQTGMRLGDFGIATARRSAINPSSGTLLFLAPEALRGASPTRRWDVYSLGVTAYDLYYGRPPFANIAEIIGDAPPSFPAPRRPEEAYFQYVLARMLERDPDKRFATVKHPRRLLAPLGRSLRPSLSGTTLVRGEFQLGPVRVRCRLGDIADSEVDGIVNSANDEMRMRTGMGAALRKRGGRVIEDEAMRGGRRALGECIATGAGTLKCQKVLHAVSAWKEASCIARATQRALMLSEELGLRTLAIPALGAGTAKVAPESSAYASASALYWHVLMGGTKLREIEYVLYDKETFDLFLEELAAVFMGDGEHPDDDPEHDSDVAHTRDVALEATLDLRGLTRQPTR
ncbi:MAG: serine/threonine-protein kinase [Minicystis sp.]